MNRSPKLWEILLAIIPVLMGVFIWVWNLGTTVKEHTKDIEYLKQDRIEYKQDIKEIKVTLQEMRIILENKEDRGQHQNQTK